MKKGTISLIIGMVMVAFSIGLTAWVLTGDRGKTEAADVDLGGGFYSDGGVTLTNYNGSGGAVTIPDGIEIVGSGSLANNDSITSITIPSSVTTIQSGAFSNDNNLTAFYVAVGNNYFSTENGILYNAGGTTIIAVPSGLTEVSIPASVSIASGAISGSTGTIYGYRNSPAETYAVANGIEFVALDDDSSGTTTYTITPSAGEGGSITPDGSTTVEEGGSVTFTFTPDSGYSIDTVTIDGTADSDGASYTSYAFTNVQADHTISVTFKQGSSSSGSGSGSSGSGSTNGSSSGSGSSGGSSGTGGSTAGGSSSTGGGSSSGRSGGSGGSGGGANGATGTTHTLDDTPKTGIEDIDPRYILCMGILLAGIAMIIYSRHKQSTLAIAREERYNDDLD